MENSPLKTADDSDRDVWPPKRVQNCTMCRRMPPHVRATLTGVTMLSTRRSSVHKIKPINFLKHFENMQTLDMHMFEQVVMATPAFQDV